MSETMTVQEHICDWNAKATEVVDFGIDAASVSSGRTPIPPQGVRINPLFSHFEALGRPRRSIFPFDGVRS